jgi:hypothetical protein
VLAKRAKAIERSLSASAIVGPCLEFNSLLADCLIFPDQLRRRSFLVVIGDVFSENHEIEQKAEVAIIADLYQRIRQLNAKRDF